MSPIPTFDEEEISTNIVDDSNLSSTCIVKDNMSNMSNEQCNDNSNRNSLCINDNKTMESMEGKCLDGLQHALRKNNNDNENLNMKVIEIESAQECTESYLEDSNSKYSPKSNDNVHRVHSVNAITLNTSDTDNGLSRDTSSDALSDARLTNNITQIAHINPELCGLPLELFTKVITPDVILITDKSFWRTFCILQKYVFICPRDIFAYLICLCPIWTSWGTLMLGDI